MKTPLTRMLSNALLIVVASSLLFGAQSVQAFCIYNDTRYRVQAQVPDGDFNETIDQGTFKCCHYSNTGCNPSGSQTSELTLWISTPDGDSADYFCLVRLQGGGYARVKEEDRSALGLPPNLYVESFTFNNQPYDDRGNYGVGASSRDVRFLVSADCQFENGNDDRNNDARATHRKMVDLLSPDRRIRGILYAGDLTQNTRVDEFEMFKTDFGGFTRFLFHGLGNHDVIEPGSGQGCDNFDHCVVPHQLRAHVRDVKRQTSKTRKGDPHYSWDWHDVHFVQLNLFPGNELPSTLPDPNPIDPSVCRDHHPMGALNFLRTDLAAHVGNSQRPVVLIHHYGLDDFSIGRDKLPPIAPGTTNEIWWTEAQRLAYWNAIESYNVVGIFTGHVHLDQGPKEWFIPWYRPAGASGGPDSIPTFVSGAALYGVFLDVEINSTNRMIVRRKDRDGNELSQVSAWPSRTFVVRQTFIDFNNGVPSNTAVYDHASVNAGVLELNANTTNQSGAFLTADLAPGENVRGFVATFKARLEGSSTPPADGFSFNWATDLPNGVYALAEEGEGSGLRICFDTHDNGGVGEAPAIDIRWGNTLVARKMVPISTLVRGTSFFDVEIRLSTDGVLDLTCGSDVIFSGLPVTGYTPLTGARFGMGGRTGLFHETHGIDDLALELYADATTGPPRFVSFDTHAPSGVVIRGTGSPLRTYTLEASADLTAWGRRADVATDEGGFWQHQETGSLPHRFFRLKGVPQFPNGLVSWYRADGNFDDSFGSNRATPEAGVTITAGRTGQAFNFDGVGGALRIGANPIPPPWTVALWVHRQDAPTGSAALFTDAVNGLKLEQPSTRRVGFTRFGVAEYSFNYVVPTNTWTYLAFVGTATATELYVNGVQRASISQTIDLPLGFLGSRHDGSDRLKGLLDEITIFNRALNGDEIRQLYHVTRRP